MKPLLRAIIVEDEEPAAERIRLLLERVYEGIIIEACLDSITDTINWLSNHPAPDLILMDIHLADGSAFEIFNQIQVDVPVIFTTAYDQYAIAAFQCLSIDYLLKPVSQDALARAVQKLEKIRVQKAVHPDYRELVNLLQEAKPVFKSRFLVRIGLRSFFLNTEDIAYFLADNKIVYAVAHDGCRYITEHTLETLEDCLDPRYFFRPNRSMIVRATAIEQIKPHINSRLKLLVKAGNSLDELVVSRERVTAFKEWAEQ